MPVKFLFTIIAEGVFEQNLGAWDTAAPRFAGGFVGGGIGHACGESYGKYNWPEDERAVELNNGNTPLQYELEWQRKYGADDDTEYAKLTAENTRLKKAKPVPKLSKKAPADKVKAAEINAPDTPKPTVKAKPAPKCK
jgi:hypothetical protein